MSVYVTPPRRKVSTVPRFRTAGRKFGHMWVAMFADTREELHAMAKDLGLEAWHFADHKFFFNYSLGPKNRADAIALGAKPMAQKDIFQQMYLKQLAAQQAAQAELEASKLRGRLAHESTFRLPGAPPAEPIDPTPTPTEAAHADDDDIGPTTADPELACPHGCVSDCEKCDDMPLCRSCDSKMVSAEGQLCNVCAGRP